ncbi:MAG: hypothetical protein ACJA0N_000617 [Pseudohongiellaceae bacterium]|jgi:hypothetical protein
MNPFIRIVSWIIALWTAKVFLFSLPYKFSGHSDTVHIFSTIGAWIQSILGDTIGTLFIDYGAYAVGSAELITSLVLLSPAAFWALKKANVTQKLPSISLVHGLGGLMAFGIMSGAVFFHIFTPLGIEVLHEGKSDNGSLFYAALSILISGLVLAVMNFFTWKASNISQQ